MRILTYQAIHQAKLQSPDAASALELWFQRMSKQQFSNLEELRQVFPSADLVGRGYIFNIGGNKLRLAASIHFNTQKVYIREIMTHAEYSKNLWKKRHQDFS